MIYMKILKLDCRRNYRLYGITNGSSNRSILTQGNNPLLFGSREKWGGGNEIHAPCACGFSITGITEILFESGVYGKPLKNKIKTI